MKLFPVLLTVLLAACHASRKVAIQPAPSPAPVVSVEKKSVTAPPADFLDSLMRRYPDWFDSLLQQRDSLRLQVIYTRIDRRADNSPAFTTFYYNVDSSKYFYPASTVKMPTALLALERLHEWAMPGISMNTTMVTEKAYSGQTAVYNDPTTAGGQPNIGQYIRKIFLVSDNDAFNRLYEFLGQQYVNERLHARGYNSVDIRHRLNIFLSADENRHTNPVKFLDGAGHLLYEQPMKVSAWPGFTRNDRWGTTLIRKNDSLIRQPFDFSAKNRISLNDLHLILRSILFPNAVSPAQRFNITPDDYRFIWKYMSMYPPESASPVYGTDSSYYDAFGKFIYWGAGKGKLPKNIRIFSKEGDAYGFLTDIAYVVDFDKRIEFMVSASIYCDRDRTVNDDRYDYETIGYPFMKHLGRALYEYELKRPRQRLPDLSAFRLTYDK